jgi:hypothetical protein
MKPVNEFFDDDISSFMEEEGSQVYIVDHVHETAIKYAKAVLREFTDQYHIASKLVESYIKRELK